MLDNLLDIEVAYSLLKSGEGDLAKDPLDVNYEKLQTDIEVTEGTVYRIYLLHIHTVSFLKPLFHPPIHL